MDTSTPTNLVELEQEAIGVRSDLAGIAIIDQPSYNAAVELRTKAKGWLKNVRENVFGPMRSSTYAAWKKVCDTEKGVCDPVETTVSTVNAALLGWDQEQERLRRVEQQRLEVEARQKAENERIAQAAELESQGAGADVVNAVLDTPVQVTEVVVAAPTYAKSSAVIYRDNWGGECFDLHQLIKAVAKDKSKIGLLQVNQPALNQMAKALKEAMDIPGCRPVNSKIVASGRG